MTSIELVMAEFGSARANAGDSNLSDLDRLEPTLSSFRQVFPDAKVTLYTDDVFVEGIDIVQIDKKTMSALSKDKSRKGYHIRDYYLAVGLLNSTADIAITMDADMRIVSEEFKTIIPLTEKFGICFPANPRLLVLEDGKKGMDSDYRMEEDPSHGNGFAINTTPISLAVKNKDARSLLETFCNLFEQKPNRMPLVMWRAIWKTGIHPYLLPFQWCVCAGHEGIGNEICLHIGHESVKNYYEENGARIIDAGTDKPKKKTFWQRVLGI